MFTVCLPLWVVPAGEIGTDWLMDWLTYALFVAPVCVMMQDCAADGKMLDCVHLAVFVPVPVWWISQAAAVQFTVFEPPAVATWSTRVDVVQFQPLPGQFGPA